jgi:hypothetical protein
VIDSKLFSQSQILRKLETVCGRALSRGKLERMTKDAKKEEDKKPLTKK